MPATPSDPLAAAIEHLRSWASAQRVAWVTGHALDDRDGVPGVRFVHEGPQSDPVASANAFTRTLSELDVAMLVVSIVTLDEESQQAAVGLYEEDPELMTGPDAEEGRAVLQSLLADAHAARNHIGQPGSAAITAITRNPTVTIEWFEMADWYAVIEAADHAFTEMAEAEFADDGDDEFEDDDGDGWVEIESEPDPEPPAPRRRAQPRG
jgi:hypothetical protein